MPTITFDEQPILTLQPKFEFDGDVTNTISASGQIRTDSASDRTPVLGPISGSFGAPVSVWFANPVQDASVRVGHIGTPGSTAVRFLDANGTLLSEQIIDTEGFATVSYTAVFKGITTVEAAPVSRDPAGFAMDDLTFGENFVFPQPDIDPLPNGPRPGTDETETLHLGDARKALGSTLRDRLGFLDYEDSFTLDFDRPTELTFSVVMDSSPNVVTETTITFAPGRQYFEVTVPVDAYPDSEGYRLFIGGYRDRTDAAAARAHQAGVNLGQSLTKAGAVDFADIASGIAQAGLRNGSDARVFYEGLSKGLGKFAVLLDLIFRIDDVVNSDDPPREMFIQYVDFALGLLFAWGGTQVGGAVGATFAGIGATVGAPLGGFSAGVTYSLTMSNAVQEAAGTYWDTDIAPNLPALQAGIDGVLDQSFPLSVTHDLVQAVTFDADWYLNTYPDAHAAIASGAMPSAYAHFVAVGAAQGHLPHEGGASIDPATLVGGGIDPATLASASWNTTAFQAEVLTLPGDGLSAGESDVIDAILALRQLGPLSIGMDPYLMAIAHRKALDLVHDPVSTPEARAMTGGPDWEDLWSNGKGLRDGISDIPTNLDDVISGDPWNLITAHVNGQMVMVVAQSADPSPDAVVSAFMAQPEGRAFLTNPNLNAIGIAEYGGIWVLMASLGIERPVFNNTETALPQLDRSGGDSGEWMALGTWQGTLDGGGGNDQLFGGRLADVLRGGADDDRLSGGAGDDTQEGGQGRDSLDGGEGNDRLFGDSFGLSDADEIAAQVFRLYRATLGRDPDAGGWLGWTERIDSGALDLTETSARFVASPEFQNTYGALDNAGFVDLLYRNVLNRSSDPDGLQGWLTALADGATRAEIVLGFSESPEFTGATRSSAQTAIDTSDPAAWSDDVFRIYRAALDRPPDVGGFANWTGRLANGLGQEALAAGFTGSPEFQNTYGVLSDAAFVELLYQNVLNRTSDAGGLRNWLDALAAGASREAVLLGFSNSTEFVNATRLPLEAWMRNQGPDDTLSGQSGENVLAGGLFADHFVFSAQTGGTHTLRDLEAWDTLVFNGFGYANATAIRSHLTDTAQGLMFSDQGVQVFIEDWSLTHLSDRMLVSDQMLSG